MNLPNKISLFRILLVFVYIFCALCIPANWGFTGILSAKSLILTFIFILGSVSDFLDGYIARKNHLITSFGKFIDPLADKALVDTALILMVFDHQASVLAVLLMIIRDLMVDGLRFMAASKGEVVSAGFFGKLKTVLQMIAIIFLLLNNWPFVYLGLPVDQVLLWAAVVASLYSGWIYFKQLKGYVLESM